MFYDALPLMIAVCSGIIVGLGIAYFLPDATTDMED